jgi:transposase
LKNISYVGVDVSAKTLAVIVEQDEQRGALFEFANDRVGHGKLIGLVTKRGRHARVVLEATGNYSLAGCGKTLSASAKLGF